jgi:uncharacterized protein YegP (UPF0339 family)
MKIEQYQDAAGAWRWRGVDGNNRIICDGSEGYLTAQGVERAIENVMTEFRADVAVIRRDKRKKLADGLAMHTDRRGTTVPGFEVLAEYEAEGAK